MAVKIGRHVQTKVTPQSQPIPGTAQVQNSAGGFVFQLDEFKQLERFLILGSEGGTYYASERALTVDNAKCVRACADKDFVATLNTIVKITEEGRAIKRDPAILALAILCTYPPEQSRLALAKLPPLCRTSTHLFQFIETLKGMRGLGRSVHRAIANWYLSKRPRDVAYQITKYPSRNGFSHRDVFRLVKPAKYKIDDAYREIFGYAVGKSLEHFSDPDVNVYMRGVQQAKEVTTEQGIVDIIDSYNLVRECIPTQWLNSPKVWDSLLVNMPAEAMLRNLGKMTSVGLLTPLSKASLMVSGRLSNPEWIAESGLHPFKILLALTTYQSGSGVKGALTWKPDQQIVSSLNDAYYSAFKNIAPTGKRFLLGVDVSGSMYDVRISGTHISAGLGAAAMAMATVRAERNVHTMGFSHELVPLPLTRTDSLESVVQKMQAIKMGRTDCAQPMLYALKHNIPVDQFVVYTDNETWFGAIHPVQALKQYRQQMNIHAKLVVVGMTATSFSIADPKDPGSFDIVGFDANAPSVISQFAAGQL